MARPVKVAAVQAEPGWNNLQASVDKTISLIEDAGKKGANVLGFPEVFIPGYPWSIWHHSPLSNTQFIHEYVKNSLVKESSEMEKIRKAVKAAGLFVVLGYSERDRGSIYIAQSFINPAGEIVLHRRKIKPTHVERSLWGDGQADSLKSVVDTPFGKWPYHITAEAESRASQFMAFEGATFVLVCTQMMTAENLDKNKLTDSPFCKAPGGGFAMIYGPDGAPLVEPLAPGEEGILYADIDLSTIDSAKQMIDVVGHYSRPDLLSLQVNTEAAKQVTTK
ncbi:MAG: hypothetical protein Q9161_005227 [Pseudevernia consocians]